jgi:MFS family permease
MLPHLAFGLLAALEMFALARGAVSATVASTVATLVAIVGLTLAVRVRLERPLATWSISTVFGLALGLGPLALRHILGAVLPGPAWVAPGVILAHAFFGSFVLGVFLLVLALTGLEHHQGFAALGHPGFRHFVRLCVHPSGRIEGFVIGKDDPLGAGGPVLVDRFEWDAAGAGAPAPTRA